MHTDAGNFALGYDCGAYMVDAAFYVLSRKVEVHALERMYGAIQPHGHPTPKYRQTTNWHTGFVTIRADSSEEGACMITARAGTPGAKDVQSVGGSGRPAGPTRKSVRSENISVSYNSSTAVRWNNEPELLIISHPGGMLSKPVGTDTVVTEFSFEFPKEVEGVAREGRKNRAEVVTPPLVDDPLLETLALDDCLRTRLPQ